MSENYSLNSPLYEAPSKPLETLTGEELCEFRFKPAKFIVDGLIKPGLTVLAGSPKIGKSWLVLQLCMQIAKGEPFWGLGTHQGSVLYIALEDSRQRLQQRVLTVADAPPSNLYFSVDCSPLGDELEREIGYFVEQHPDTRVIVFDTFQKIRQQELQMSYANDYADVSQLKRIADTLNICILLVHHTRKLGDSDRVNEISGTNGIAGSADTLMVLAKEKRAGRKATLTCTGRDISDLELNLTMDREYCLWRCDTPIKSGRKELPPELNDLIRFMKYRKTYEGGNTAFTEQFCRYSNRNLNAAHFKMLMNRFRYELEDHGVTFLNMRTAKERTLMICYSEKHDLYKTSASEKHTVTVDDNGKKSPLSCHEPTV